MDKIICIKDNGKVKLIENQFDLNALDRSKYLVYLYPTGIFSSVFKPINPKSGWTRPIKKAVVDYSMNLYMAGSFVEDEYEEECLDDPISRHAEFDDVIGLVAFINSLEKLTSLNVIKNAGFDQAIFFEGFHMELTDVSGKTREFNMTQKKAKKHKDIFSKIGFGVPSLILELMDFMDDLNKYNFTNPYVFNQNYIFISDDLKEWKAGNMAKYNKKDWFVTTPLVQIGACTLIRSDIMYFMNAMHYSGTVSIVTYAFTYDGDEDNLPFECPITEELISENSGTFFELYDDRRYNLLTAADIIEASTMLPYYIKASRYIFDITEDAALRDGMKFMSQIKLFPSMLTPAREIDPPPLKYMIYEDDLDMLSTDQSVSDFIRSLLLWVEHPVDVDGLAYLDLSEPF